MDALKTSAECNSCSAKFSKKVERKQCQQCRLHYCKGCLCTLKVRSWFSRNKRFCGRCLAAWQEKTAKLKSHSAEHELRESSNRDSLEFMRPSETSIVLTGLHAAGYPQSPVPNKRKFLKTLREAVRLSEQDPRELYEIEKKFAKGSQGVLYTAVHRATQHRVALKRAKLKPGQGLALNEVGMLKISQHPNVVALEEAFKFRG